MCWLKRVLPALPRATFEAAIDLGGAAVRAAAALTLAYRIV